ncbi:MAG: prepilin peptidase [Chloroflexi bacterium]|nr:MAG: prepilin peptidase [Chloroflexota bacterium]
MTPQYFTLWRDVLQTLSPTLWMIGIVAGSLLSTGVNILADWLPGHLQYPGSSPQERRRIRRWLATWLACSLLGVLALARIWSIWGGWRPWLYGVVLVYGGLLIATAVIDIEYRRVPNVLLLPLAALAMIVAGLHAQYNQAVMGGVIGWLMFHTAAALRPGALGLGDIKLAAVIGLMLGFPNAVYALGFGIIAGGLGALGLILARRATLKSTLAYAPYLVLGGLVVLLQHLEVIG